MGLERAERVSVLSVRAVRHVTAAPARYTEAGLVRRLEALGIGRPSTWAAVLAVLQERGYLRPVPAGQWCLVFRHVGI